MLTFIGVTLIFAGATAALGIEIALRRARALYPHPISPWPVIVQSAMMLWFFGAGIWALYEVIKPTN